MPRKSSLWASIRQAPRLLEAMFDVGYFPPNTPPGSPVRVHQEGAEHSPSRSHAHEDRENQDVVVVHCCHAPQKLSR